MPGVKKVQENSKPNDSAERTRDLVGKFKNDLSLDNSKNTLDILDEKRPSNNLGKDLKNMSLATSNIVEHPNQESLRQSVSKSRSRARNKNGEIVNDLNPINQKQKLSENYMKVIRDRKLKEEQLRKKEQQLFLEEELEKRLKNKKSPEELEIDKKLSKLEAQWRGVFGERQ